MGINNILIENTRAHRSLPAARQIGRSGGVSRDEGHNGREKKEVPFIPLNGDSVAISSGSGTEIRQDLLQFHVSFTRNRIEIKGNDHDTPQKASPDIFASQAEGVALTDSKAVQEERSIGPYSLHVNRSAIKRYEQARSYRNWHATTFELTV